MEHFWSRAGATIGNPWQMGRARKPLKQADPHPVATHGNRFAAHGKEGVDGSSPSEGFSFLQPSRRSPTRFADDSSLSEAVDPAFEVAALAGEDVGVAEGVGEQCSALDAG